MQQEQLTAAHEKPDSEATRQVEWASSTRSDTVSKQQTMTTTVKIGIAAAWQNEVMDQAHQNKTSNYPDPSVSQRNQ